MNSAASSDWRPELAGQTPHEALYRLPKEIGFGRASEQAIDELEFVQDVVPPGREGSRSV